MARSQKRWTANTVIPAKGNSMGSFLKIIAVMLVIIGLAWLVHRYGNADLLVVFLTMAMTLPVLYLVVDRSVQKNKLLRLREEALRAEVALLKNQINPHFFFNTLNNLYGLVMEQSPLAPHLVLKLSDLMRFTIYEGRKDHVPLRDELAYLENYLEIQRMRARQTSVAIRFDTEVVDDLVEVPPLLFILLIENAFKHGVNSATNPYVHVHLKATLKAVDLVVENNFEKQADQPAGIGLENLRKRLALIFPKRHQFTTSDHNGVFIATLRLDL